MIDEPSAEAGWKGSVAVAAPRRQIGGRRERGRR